MSHLGKRRPARGNYLLSSLSDDCYGAIAPLLWLVELESKQILHERGQPFSDWLYFPITCVLSAVASMEDGMKVEVASVGNEGFSASEILVGGTSPVNTVFCQIPGQSMRMSVADFRGCLDSAPELRKFALRYLQGFISQMIQTAGCNIGHPAEARLARWILTTHDRIEGDGFRVTLDIIAVMLGMDNRDANQLASRFQQAGLTSYKHSHLHILDRSGIEEITCECYFNMQRQYSRLRDNEYIGNNVMA